MSFRVHCALKVQTFDLTYEIVFKQIKTGSEKELTNKIFVVPKHIKVFF